jgi:signal transduction histidine kinase/CheY-like chemotaxis protein
MTLHARTGATLRSLRDSLSSRIAGSLLLLFLVALLILATDLYLSGQMRSDGVAVDVAGTERMRVYRLSTLIHALVRELGDGAGPEQAESDLRARIGEEIRAFEAILSGLRDGDPAYGLLPAPTTEIRNQIDATIRRWETAVKPAVRAALETTSGDEAAKGLAEYERVAAELVESVDKIVKGMAADSTRKVEYQYLVGQVLFLLLLVIGAGTGYLMHRFVVWPLLGLASATREMGKGNLSRRVAPATSPLIPAEVRELAMAFNDMADSIQASAQRCRAAERLSRRILATLPDAVIVVGRDCTVRYANRVFYHWFGLEPSAVGGRPLRGVLPFAGAVDRIEEIVGEKGYGAPFEAVWHAEGGEPRTFRVVVSGLQITEEDEEEGILVLLEETTAFRCMVQKQQTLQAQLIQAEKLSALGQLLSGVAHELNNPLTVIAGRATLLLRGERDGRTRPALEAIQKNADRMKRIIQSQLRLARPYPPERAWLDLNALIQETVEIRASGMRLNNLEVRLALDDGAPRIFADPHQLQQVFLNVITNAEHAMAGGPGMLTISTRRVGETIRVSLADTGPGIAPEHLPRVFDPFFTTKEVGHGTGLGLSVSYSIVEAHDGRIRAESRAGEGATFVVELPIVTEVLPEPAAPPESSALRPLTGRRVLVVDDEEEILQVLLELLELDGHHVEIARNGAEALACLSGGACDVILSDVRMPELDGRALYRVLEEQQSELVRRLVFITGDTVSPETRTFLEETGVPYIAKPFELDAVRDALARTCVAPRGA